MSTITTQTNRSWEEHSPNNNLKQDQTTPPPSRASLGQKAQSPTRTTGLGRSATQQKTKRQRHISPPLIEASLGAEGTIAAQFQQAMGRVPTKQRSQTRSNDPPAFRSTTGGCKRDRNPRPKGHGKSTHQTPVQNKTKHPPAPRSITRGQQAQSQTEVNMPRKEYSPNNDGKQDKTTPPLLGAITGGFVSTIANPGTTSLPGEVKKQYRGSPPPPPLGGRWRGRTQSSRDRAIQYREVQR